MCGLNDEMVSTERGWSLEWGHTSTRSSASKRPSFAIPTQDEQIKEGSARSLQASCEPRQSTCHAWQILCFHDFACYASCLDVVPFALLHGPLSSVGLCGGGGWFPWVGFLCPLLVSGKCCFPEFPLSGFVGGLRVDN